MVPECWHGDECPWHKRGRCLFKHCAPPSVELTGGDVPVEQQLRDLRRALQRLAAAVMWRDGVPIPQVVKGTLETMTERTQVIDVTVPQTTEELQERISERVHEQIVDIPVPIAQPGDQACRGSADAVPRQGCRYACRDAKTGPSTVDQPGDQARRVHTEFIHRQVCRSPCGDAVTGTSDTDGFEDCESPAGAVHQPSSGRALEEIVEAISAPHERVQQRTVEHRIVERLSMCQRLRSWKRSSRRFRPHMNECNSEPSSIVLSNRLSMCQRLRSWKRSSRRFRPHMNECNSEPSSIVLSSRLSMCQRLRSWKRSSRRVRPHMNECNSERLRSWKRSLRRSAPHNECNSEPSSIVLRADCRCANASDPGRDRRGGFGPT